MSGSGVAASLSYDDLLTLFADWREFESPPMTNGAPDYTAEQFAARHDDFEALQARLQAFETNEWPIPQQVDWHLVRAEMNGYDFNERILKPWARDPAFYKTTWTYRSDVPGHEGPTHHAVVELWTYDFPLSESEEQRLTAELGVVPPLMKQAQKNLTGNARELWIAGIRDIRDQSAVLRELKVRVDDSASDALKDVIERSLVASDELVAWLESEAKSKTGPSGLGKENYTWYLNNVHLVPMSWEDEVRLMQRELARAWSMLKLEEQRNRELPPMVAASSPEEYDEMANDAIQRIMEFLERKEIVTIAEYMEPALREHAGAFVPEESRNFFWITAHYDPAPLFTHFYHWFELARMDLEPHASPVRQGALLYNIFDSRNEGTATAVEEIFMNAGLYDDSPRSRELVWIMLAQRAARGLGSLYAHANEMTMEEAGGLHIEWTPRGWMKTEEDLVKFEQHLYLRQPGYGTSYVTGKYLLDETLKDYAWQAEQSGEEFRLKDFFDKLNAIDSIPISLGRWELTGLRDPNVHSAE
ncbi:MAG: DUF885 domain-containing protein [Gammaproteobacteria bacterium]|nr:DUF885 domain-containing protein [Gammaproteobacteria bacterium]